MGNEEASINPFDANPYDEVDERHDSWDLRHTEFRELVMSVVDENHLKWDTRAAIIVLVNDIMSSNAFMSNQTPPKKGMRRLLEGEDSFNQFEYTLLSIDECIETCLASVDPLDRNKNIVFQIITDIKNHTENFTLTRTVGKDREGLLNRIKHNKETQEIKSTEVSEQESIKIKKGGIL